MREVSNDKGKVMYLNSGDWVENLTALEYNNGDWEQIKVVTGVITEWEEE